ncbi:unnamed protein product [Thlaspi arvense]|uniref:Pectinesterase inhibitor domain-containing protein n=1 Tax=Thlaspi arvense TaxID=13288 RepID=A0AAU9RNP7_THLAR|nr:unnamed protein product [Thlaspi arvense]
MIVLFLLLDGITSNKVANSLIRDSCKRAAKIKEKHFYKFCLMSINENPESQKARNVDDLIIVGVHNAMSNMTKVKGVVEKILKERKYKSKLSEKSLRDCLQLYSEGNDSLTKALKMY